MTERRRKRQDNGAGGAPPAVRPAPDDRPLGRDRPVGFAGGEVDAGPAWGSDVVARVLRDLGIPFIALNPGASFRGLHDSLVNFLGNERPEMILCLHEEHAVGIAHGYAKVTGR
ncbi:MAG TPA: thiamine pyrophosphate-binding protein, partial [Kiloniellales bacterium]|nr:thiamine pyrophosphate-binding protein [Kiloniellales bacterium]